jgi:hypothetical protein
LVCPQDADDGPTQPFLAQAEQDRSEYDAAKKLYDEATTGHSSGVSFSVHQGGGFVHSMLLPTPVPALVVDQPSSPGSESEDDRPRARAPRRRA